MGCGASSPAPAAAPTPAPTPSTAAAEVAATNKTLLALQATGGGSLLLSAGGGGGGGSSGGGSAAAPETPGDVDVTKGGSYIVGRLQPDVVLGGGVAYEEVPPLPATRQCYIPQPDGAVLRLSYGYASQCGYNASAAGKVNQDSLLVAERLGGLEHAALFSVFDGHGPRGEDAAHFCRHNLAPTVTLDARGRPSALFREDPVKGLGDAFPRLHANLVASATAAVHSGGSSAAPSLGSAAAGTSIGRAAARLMGGSGGDSVVLPPAQPSGAASGGKAAVPWRSVDVEVSGSTANAVLVLGNSLICANCGDSRAILVSSAPRRGGGASPASPEGTPAAEGGGGGNPHLGTVKVSPLSKDHKPSRTEERARISRTSAQIISESMLLPGGDAGKLYVCRQVGNHIKYGVLFTRSIGDVDSHTHLGLTAEAETRVQALRRGHDRFMVLATDGVWDYMSNKDVAKAVARSLAVSWKAAHGEGSDGAWAPGQDAQAAANELLGAAAKRWTRADMGRQDDITAMVVAFTWMGAEEAAEDAAQWAAWHARATGAGSEGGEEVDVSLGSDGGESAVRLGSGPSDAVGVSVTMTLSGDSSAPSGRGQRDDTPASEVAAPTVLPPARAATPPTAPPDSGSFEYGEGGFGYGEHAYDHDAAAYDEGGTGHDHDAAAYDEEGGAEQ